jgi:hypothetical protein
MCRAAWEETSIDPATIFPVLAAGFVGLAGWRYARTRQWRGAVATWLLLALWFAGVALWLQFDRA